MEQGDHRAGRLADDPLDQAEGVIRALAEPDERDVGSLAGGHRADVLDLDLPGDHLVSQRRDDRGDESKAILALVGDQHAQMLGFAVAHLAPARPRLDSKRADASSVVRSCRSPQPLGERVVPAPTLGRRMASIHLGRCRRERWEPSMHLSSPKHPNVAARMAHWSGAAPQEGDLGLARASSSSSSRSGNMVGTTQISDVDQFSGEAAPGRGGARPRRTAAGRRGRLRPERHAHRRGSGVPGGGAPT